MLSPSRPVPRRFHWSALYVLPQKTALPGSVYGNKVSNARVPRPLGCVAFLSNVLWFYPISSPHLPPVEPAIFNGMLVENTQ